MAAPMMSNEDYSLIKSFLIIPVVLSVFERDSQIIGKFAMLKTPDPYVDVIQSGMQRATTVLAEVRRELRNHGIKVYEVVRTAKGIEAKYQCRGYHSEFSMLWSLVQADVSVRMRAYMGLDISEFVRHDLDEHEREIIH